jgi:SAM-dependent methyltransferase
MMHKVSEIYHEWRRRTFPASKHDVAWRYDAMQFRLDHLEALIEGRISDLHGELSDFRSSLRLKSVAEERESGLHERLSELNANIERLMKQISRLELDIVRLSAKADPASHCPICAQETGKIVAVNILKDGCSCPVRECDSCGHKFCFPLPASEVIRSCYQDEGYFTQNCSNQGIMSFELSPEWSGFLGARQNAFDRMLAKYFCRGIKLRVGEIGCLEGAFLKTLSDQGHSVTGFEINASIAKKAAQYYKIDIRNVDFENDHLDIELDAIISFHSFEHLRNPLHATEKACHMLRPGGALLLEVPCDDDEMNNPDHFHFFTKSSLERLLDPFFEDVEIIENSYARDGRGVLGSLFAFGRKRTSALAAQGDDAIGL